MSKRSLSDKIQQEINVANMNGNVHAERAYKRCLNIIRQHEAEHPFKEVDDDGWPLEKPSEIRLTKEEWADKILAEFKTEGNRTKVEEWEAAYAMLFKQLNSLPEPVSVSLGEIRNSIEVRSARDVTEVIEVTLRKVGVPYVD